MPGFQVLGKTLALADLAGEINYVPGSCQGLLSLVPESSPGRD